MPVYFGYGSRLTKAVKTLLILNGAIFAITLLLPYKNVVMNLFGLVPYRVTNNFMIWQFFTYMFLHSTSNIFHILFNMFALWMFGSELERNWGTKDFATYYLTCGVGGGLLVWITSFFNLSSPLIPTIGASGAIFGLLIAFGMMWPDRMIYVFGILPMKALHFVLIFGGIDLLQGLGRVGGGVAYFAHVGGLATGFLYLKFGWRIMVHLEYFFKKNNLGDIFKKKNFTVIEGGKSTRRTSDSSEDNHPDIDREVDRILDKIARDGIDSLTDREKRILDRVSKRGKKQ